MLITDAPYQFHGMPRWSFGFPDPNLAGICLASLIPLLWYLSAWRNFRVLSLSTALNGLLYFLLAKTYSRGALVAVVVAGLFLLVASRSGSQPSTRGIWAWGGVQAFMLVVIVAAVGFWGRISPAYVEKDRSVLSRYSLWEGGMKMATVSPLTGWGNHQSGLAYGDWFEEVNDTRSYRGLVNTYLDLAVNAGLPLFALCLTGLFMVIAVPLMGVGHASSSLFVAALASSVVGFATACFFSSLWEYPRLVWLPAVAAVLVLARIRFLPRNLQMKVLLGGMIPTALVLLAIVAGVAARATPASFTVEFSDGFVALTPGGKPNPGRQKILVVPSVQLMGTSFGKVCRQLAVKVGAQSDVISLQYPGIDFTAKSWDTVVVIGEAVALLGSVNATRIIILCPSEPPPKRSDRTVEKVVLNEMNFESVNAAWAEWAKQRGSRVEFTPTRERLVDADAIAHALAP